MKPVFYTLFIFLFWVNALFSQNTVELQIEPALLNVQPGQNVSVNIRVRNFADIQAYQFSMRWNPAVVQFQNITYLNLGLSAGNFNTLNTASGILSAAQLLGTSTNLPDGSALFALNFLVIGSSGSASDVTFENTPTVTEFYNSNVVKLPHQATKGKINVQGQGPFLQAFPLPLYEDGALYFKINDQILLDVTYIPGNPNASTPELYPIFQKYGVSNFLRPFEVIDKPVFLRIYRVHFDQIDGIEDFIKDLSALPFVQFAEKVPLKETTAPPPITPNDPAITGGIGMDAYQLGLMRAYDAFGLPLGSGGTIVAVVDDAVLTSHEDLAASMYFSNWDVADNDANPNPPFNGTNAAGANKFSHGTHVAGIAGGTTNNNLGVASIGWGNKIMGVKCVSNTAAQTTNLAFAYDGVAWASVNGAQVINMSWGGTAYSQAEYLVIKNAYDSGIILVAAAGNYFSSNAFYPAAYGEGKTNQSWEILNKKLVVAVSALDRNNNHSVWGSTFFGISGSNFGSWVDISAYGTDIFSSVAGSASGNAVNNLYTDYNGTSMAAPQIAGLAGIMRSYKPTATRDEIIDCLLNNTNPDIYNPVVHADNVPGTLGSGRVDAYNALRCLGVPCPGPDAPLAYVTPAPPTLCPGGTTTLTANNANSYLWSTFATTQSISVTSPGPYTVTITFSGGCTAATSVNVVPALTTAGIKIIDGSGNTANDGILCGQDFLFLAAYSGSTYQWNTFGATTPSIGPINAGLTTPFTHNFTVTVTDVGGCAGLTSSATVTITWLDPPDATINIAENSETANDGILCPGASAALSATGGISYVWSNLSTTASINVTPLATTTYIVTVTDANGCTGTSSVQVVMLPDCTDVCCQNQPAFLTAAQQGFNALEQQCGITLSPNALSDCQQTTYTWGDGSSTGPITGNASANHLYTHPGFYDVCAKVQEINDMGVACFTYDTCWQVCVTCDTCKMPMLKDVWSKLPATTNYGGGNNSYAQIYKDQTGDYYMIGTYSGTFDNGADPDFANQGDLDCVVAKYHNDGTLVPGFAFNIGGSLFDVGATIAPHPTNGFFVGGIFHSPTLTLTAPGSGPDAILNRKSANTHADVFLARYDNAMNIVWALNFGGLNNTQINDMAVDADGNVVITGQALAKTNYDPLGTATTSTVDNYAAYTAKYNGSDGKLIWVRSVIGALHLGLDLDNAGNTYVGGHFQGPAFLEGSPVPGGGFPALGINSVISSSSDVAPFIIKFDPNGDFQWVLPIQNASGPKTATGVVWDVSVKDGNLFATGNAVTNVALDFGGSAITLPATSGQFVARYNLNGVVEDHAVLPQNSKAFKLETVNGGKVYVGGTYGGGVMMTEIYDHDLNPIKTLYTAPGSNQDAVWAMAPDISGDFVIAGITGGSSLDLDPGANDGLEYPTLAAPTFVWAKYTCDCPGPAPTICSPCDSISANFLNKTNGKECCGGVRVNNLLANTFSGIQINVVSGGTMPILNVTPRTGWQITGFIDGQSVNLEPTGGGPIPTGFNNTAFVCFENLTAAEQVVEIKYFNLKDSVVCRDTLRFRCDYCVKFSRDSVTCKGFDKRELTFCVSVPLTQDWHVNSLVLASPIAGITLNPSAFSLPNIAPGTTSCTYTTTINIAAGTALPDTLCLKLTAHQMDITQGKPPGECCMTEACVAIPDCLCDSTWTTAQSIDFKGDTCCWRFSLTNPNGVFNSINTEIITPGVVFSTLAGAPGWMLDFNSVTDVNWLPQAPQGSFIQNGYALPTVCFGEASLGSFVSPFEVAFTWTTPEGITCDTTLELECPWMETGSSDCVILDSVRFKCPPASGLPFQLTVEVINNTFAPAFHAEKVTFVPLSPAGLNISPAMTNVSIPNGGSANVTLDITGPIPAGSLFCFMAILHDLDAQGNERNCCSSDTFCYRMPFCPFFNMGDPIALFPNPTRDRFGLYFSESTPANSRIRLLDVSGRLVLEQPIEVGAISHLMSLEAYPSGLYFVEFLENQKRIWLDKVVRQ